MEASKLRFSVLQNAANVKRANEVALKANIEQAENGDMIGFFRMADRYKKGDGVEKDLAKAKIYLDKALVLSNAFEEQLLILKKNKEQAQLEKKIEWARDQANKGNFSGMVFLGKCYRDGIGFEKNIEKQQNVHLLMKKK